MAKKVTKLSNDLILVWDDILSIVGNRKLLRLDSVKITDYSVIIAKKTTEAVAGDFGPETDVRNNKYYFKPVGATDTYATVPFSSAFGRITFEFDFDMAGADFNAKLQKYFAYIKEYYKDPRSKPIMVEIPTLTGTAATDTTIIGNFIFEFDTAFNVNDPITLRPDRPILFFIDSIKVANENEASTIIWAFLKYATDRSKGIAPIKPATPTPPKATTKPAAKSDSDTSTPTPDPATTQQQ